MKDSTDYQNKVQKIPMYSSTGLTVKRRYSLVKSFKCYKDLTKITAHQILLKK